MISAFGVEHEDISKRLPSALRAGKPMFNQSANKRISANVEGKRASKLTSIAERENNPFKRVIGNAFKASGQRDARDAKSMVNANMRTKKRILP